MTMNVKTMEAKKTQKSSGLTSTQTKGVTNFFSDVKAEFKKITWTSKEELQTYTKIVVGATFVCGMSVYVIDLGIRACLSGLEAFTRLIFG